MIRPATSRTCPTEPGAPEQSAALSVCTESITHTSGASAASVSRIVSRSVSARIGTFERRPDGRDPGAVSARSLTCSADSSPLTYSVRWPAPVQVPERHVRERRLADPRRAAQQHERSRHEAAAEHAIELADPRRQAPHRGRAPPRLSGRGPVPGGLRRPSRRRRRARAPGRPSARVARTRSSHERVPRLAPGALAVPLGGLETALRAAVDGLARASTASLRVGGDALVEASAPLCRRPPWAVPTAPGATIYVMVCGASGDLTGAKGAETVLTLTGLDVVKAHVGRWLGVSDCSWSPRRTSMGSRR